MHDVQNGKLLLCVRPEKLHILPQSIKIYDIILRRRYIVLMV